MPPCSSIHFLTLGGAVPIRKSVNAPLDPCFALPIREPRASSQGSGLKRKGEFGNRFKGSAGNRSRNHFGNQACQSNLVSGFVRPIESGFHDLAVIGVVGRIGFDGELPDASQILFARYRNSKGRIGAEGLPVTSGLAVLETKNHGNWITIELRLHDRTLLAFFGKWVVIRALAHLARIY